jgi:predicted RNA-binding protein with PUA-like domain
MTSQSKPGVRYWLMKSEPREFSITDLKKQKRARWGDIRNYQVRNMLRDDMKVGDMAIFYHSSCEEIGAAGEMRIIQAAYLDPSQFDQSSRYYDAESQLKNPRWLAVNVQFVTEFPQVLPLSQIKRDHVFKNLALVQKGNRLSVMPISPHHYARLVALATDV